MACSTATIQAGLNLTADGVYGPNTTNAVKALQQGVGAGVDGQYGPDTSAHVAVVQSGIGAGSDGCYGPDTNRHVQVIQLGVRVGVDGFYGPGTRGGVANAQSHLGIPNDGIYGPQTHQAVADFQSSHGLAVDGILGPVTGNALFGAPAPGPAPGPGPGPGGTLAGDFPDVSSFQGDIDWNAVRGAGYYFAYVKASEGTNFQDPRFTSGRVQAMRQAGVLIGNYHFLRPQGGRAGADEARYFLDTCRSRGSLGHGDPAPVCDFEVTTLNPTDTFNYLASFVGEVHNQGYPCGIYTGQPNWQANTPGPNGSPDGLGCFGWVAAYGPSFREPWAWDSSQGRGGVAAWQFTDAAGIPGIPGGVDKSHGFFVWRIG